MHSVKSYANSRIKRFIGHKTIRMLCNIVLLILHRAFFFFFQVFFSRALIYSHTHIHIYVLQRMLFHFSIFIALVSNLHRRCSVCERNFNFPLCKLRICGKFRMCVLDLWRSWRLLQKNLNIYSTFSKRRQAADKNAVAKHVTKLQFDVGATKICNLLLNNNTHTHIHKC